MYFLLRLGGIGSCTYGLQFFLDFRVKGPSLHCDDPRGRIRIMRDWRTAFRAEDTVDCLAGASHASPALGRAIDREFVLRDYSDES